MKITVTREFNNVDEAIEFIGAMDAPRYALLRSDASLDPASLGAVINLPSQTPGPNPIVKKPRKPRADAGQPRGPYKPRGSAGTAAPDTKAKPEGAGRESSGGNSSSADAQDHATPSGEAPTSAAPVKSSSVEAPQAAQAPGAAELTEADVRATLGLLNSAPGGGMGACIKAIKDFGYERITAIPKEKYAEFDAYIRALLPKGS